MKHAIWLKRSSKVHVKGGILRNVWGAHRTRTWHLAQLLREEREAAERAAGKTMGRAALAVLVILLILTMRKNKNNHDKRYN